jgi:hypothetical protein
MIWRNYAEKSDDHAGGDCGDASSAANLLEDASLQWTVSATPSGSTVVKEAGKVRFRKTAADAISSSSTGKLYRSIPQILPGDDETSGLADRLTRPADEQLPGYEERNRTISPRPSQMAWRRSYLPRRSGRMHFASFRAGGTGEVILKELTVAEYRRQPVMIRKTFPGTAQGAPDSLPDEWKN